MSEQEVGLVHWCQAPPSPRAAEPPSLRVIQATNVSASRGPQRGCEGEGPAPSHLKSCVEGAAAEGEMLLPPVPRPWPRSRPWSRSRPIIPHWTTATISFLKCLWPKPSLRPISSESLWGFGGVPSITLGPHEFLQSVNCR